MPWFYWPLLSSPELPISTGLYRVLSVFSQSMQPSHMRNTLGCDYNKSLSEKKKNTNNKQIKSWTIIFFFRSVSRLLQKRAKHTIEILTFENKQKQKMYLDLNAFFLGRINLREAQVGF